jgi:hypothetical protein
MFLTSVDLRNEWLRACFCSLIVEKMAFCQREKQSVSGKLLYIDETGHNQRQ